MTHSTVAIEASAGSSPDLAACMSPDDLKQYLSGWCDDAQAERIEVHLASCPACEQALRALDFKPDTLMQSLQSTAVEKARTIDDVAPSPVADQPIDAALATARRLMDVPVVGRLNHPSIVAATDAGEMVAENKINRVPIGPRLHGSARGDAHAVKRRGYSLPRLPAREFHQHFLSPVDAIAKRIERPLDL